MHPVRTVPGMDRSDIHPIAQVVTVLFAVAVGLYGLVCTWVAFAGGTVPLLGWEFQANPFQGLAFLIFVEPLIITVGFWVSMIVVIPLDLLLKAIDRRR